MAPKISERTTSFGETFHLTPVDRFGVWLSSRQVHRFVPEFAGKKVGDFGCGYEAALDRTLIEIAGQLTLVDVSLAADLKQDKRIRCIEGRMPEALAAIYSGTLDIVLCLSVLEHLWHPLETLVECHRVLAPDGVCLVNVPSWTGKRWLELSAFRLGLSAPSEIDDHKCYYDPKDLWPLIVRAGFCPSNIQCFKHKFGLNTFAVCRRAGASPE